jgi:ElaB/YqjD/DUF883 family membrane-anchored ribosome-binding protein
MDHLRHRRRPWTSVAVLWNAAVAIGLVLGLLLPVLATPG